MARLSDFFRFSRRETRGVLWLLPLLAAISLVWSVEGEVWSSPMVEVEGESNVLQRHPEYSCVAGEGSRRESSANSRDEILRLAQGDAKTNNSTLPALTPFDPNALTVSGFEALGFSPRQAQAIVNYRTARGGFRTADDFGRSFVVSPEMMERLRPYIAIAAREESAARDTPHVAPAEKIEGKSTFTEKKLLDINTADSAALRTVSGIGNVLVVRIMEYRQRLGGYVSIEQLREIPGMTPENFERIRPQIFADNAVIRKISVNFAPAEVLGKHPYITASMLRKLLKNRQLKGGWSTTQELTEQNIITEDQARRLDPYLIYER